MRWSVCELYAESAQFGIDFLEIIRHAVAINSIWNLACCENGIEELKHLSVILSRA